MTVTSYASLSSPVMPFCCHMMYVLILVAFSWMTLIEMLTCLNKVFVMQHLALFRACFEVGEREMFVPSVNLVGCNELHLGL